MATNPPPHYSESASREILAQQRTKRVRAYTHNKVVLDFGCGANAWAARELRPHCRRIDGIEPTVEPGIIYGIPVVNSLDKLQKSDYEAVIALAVFEHLHPIDFRQILHLLDAYTIPQAKVIGTVPTHLAKPVLELLSYRLGLIDSSQIRDHKVYYDDLWLAETLRDTPWKVHSYQTFQFGLNSVFVLGKR